jgi:hypothetical protein
LYHWQLTDAYFQLASTLAGNAGRQKGDAMRSCRTLSIFTLLFFLSLQGSSVAAGSPPFTPHRNTTVMTYNVYLGADISPILAAENQQELVLAVTAAFGQVGASDVPLRMSQIAGAISASLPDLVGLQEVDLLSVDGSV